MLRLIAISSITISALPFFMKHGQLTLCSSSGAEPNTYVLLLQKGVCCYQTLIPTGSPVAISF